MNKINRILTQIHELEEELARELETTQIATALNTIVNSNLENIDDSYSLYPISESSVFTFGLPRGTGKTKFLIEQVKANKNSTVIWFNNQQTLQRVLNEYKDFPKDRCIILRGSAIDLPRGVVLEKPITQILIDEYQNLSGENLFRIVDACYLINRDKTVIKIIRVGTPPL